MGNPPPTHLITPISDERRGEILDETLARRPHDGPLRIFGYGSLMWSPCFDVADSHLCTLRDYHRGFSIWSVFARGTPEHPGLGFALEEKVDSIILSIDSKNRTINLSIKELEIRDEKEALNKYGSSASGASLGDILGSVLKK